MLYLILIRHERDIFSTIASSSTFLFPLETVVARSISYYMFYNVFSFVWCNVLMYVYVCLLVPVRLHFTLRIDRDPFPSFEESKIKLRRPTGQVLRVLQS
jgi:hypothetical protein